MKTQILSTIQLAIASRPCVMVADFFAMIDSEFSQSWEFTEALLASMKGRREA